MPQYIAPTEQRLFIDGCYHGKRIDVRPGAPYINVVKPHPSPVLADFDLVVKPEPLQTQTYSRRELLYKIAPTKDAKRHKVRVFVVYALESMSDSDACRELMYMLLRTPARRLEASKNA